MKIIVEPIFVGKEVACNLVGLSESTWDKLVAEGQAPKPRQTSDKRVGWLLTELRQWAESRPISQVLPPFNAGQGRRPKTQDAQKAV